MTIAPYPLRWPAARPRRPSGLRKDGKFRATAAVSGGHYRKIVDLSIADAIRRLLAELERIGARHHVISTNIEPRLDGLPRSLNAKLPDPGVAVYFQLGTDAHCLPCDTYSDVAQNIAAIAAHIEATRAIERHGVASIKDMFRGFVALPQPKSCWEILGIRPSSPRDAIEEAFRELAKQRHPDHGGSTEAMAELNRARHEALSKIAC